MRAWACVGMVALAASGACRRAPATAGDASVAEPDYPPRLALTKDRKDLLFSYVDEGGKMRDVDAAQKVPRDRQKQVLVRDLSKRPEEVRADQYVYLADLTREVDGGWPYSVVSRYGVDQAIKGGDLGPMDDEQALDGAPAGVVLYGTSWCGACAQARAWLKRRGVAFADRDVEKDPKAQAEMARKARRAGIEVRGVPVIDVGGKIVQGFDESELARLLGGT